MRRVIPVLIAWVCLSMLIAPAVLYAAPPTPQPSALALDASAFPAGAVITRNRVDRTGAAVNAEGILGGSPDKHGALYQRLHFVGSLTERAILPRFNGAARDVWLMATVFPTADAAAQAYGTDSDFGDACGASPPVPISTPTQTCTYDDAKTGEAGMYVVGTTGPVEYIVVAFIEHASFPAHEQAIRDGSSVAMRLSSRIDAALHLKEQHSPPAATPTPMASPTAPPQRIAPRPSPTMTPLPSATPVTPTMHGYWKTVKQWVVPAGFDSITPMTGETATIGRLYAVRIVAPHAGEEISGQIMSQYSTSDDVRGEKDVDYDARHAVFIKVPAPPRAAAYWWINSWLYHGPVGTKLTLLMWQMGG